MSDWRRLALSLILIASGLFIGITTVSAQGSNFAVNVAGISKTIEDLSDSSPMIVEVYVQSVFPATEVGRTLETDVRLRVERIIKGASPGPEIVVSQMGGVLGDRRQLTTQFSLMQAGEHYVLFLESPPPPSNVQPRTIYLPPPVPVQRPDRGLPRFKIKGEFVGLMRIEGESVRWSAGMPPEWKAKYDGQNARKSLSELQAHINPR